MKTTVLLSAYQLGRNQHLAVGTNSLFGCETKTMWCCADIKLPQCIMVIITPFIKIGQLSKHLASIVRLKSVLGFGSWSVPHIFQDFFFSFLSLTAVGDLMTLKTDNVWWGRGTAGFWVIGFVFR